MPASRPVHLLLSLLAHRYVPIMLPLIAVALTVPALWHGLMLDDYIFRARLIDSSFAGERLHETGWVPAGSGTPSWSIQNLYRLLGPDLDLQKLMDSGTAPWWTSRSTMVSFWRPLAAIGDWVDYRLWPDRVGLMQAHNLFWFAAAMIAVSLLYRSLIRPLWAAGLAASLYVLDDSFFTAVSWIANRHTLMSLFFGVLAVLAHHHARSRKSGFFGVLSILALVLSLLSAEAGVAVLAYLGAYSLFADDDRPAGRVLSLVPSIVTVFLWRLVYGSLGHGVSHNGLYLDPAAEPVRFVAALAERGPIVLVSQLGPQPAVLYNFLSESMQAVSWSFAVAYVALALAVMAPLLKRNKIAQFWTVGMLASAAPVCCCEFTDDRTLCFVGLGAIGLIAQFLAGLFRRESWTRRNRMWRFAAWTLATVLILTHVAAVPVLRLIRFHGTPVFMESFFEPALDIGDSPELQERDLIVVNAPCPLFFAYLPFLRSAQSVPIPRRVRILAPAYAAVELVRTGEKELVVRSLASSLTAPESSKQEHLVHEVRGYRIGSNLFTEASCRRRVGERVILNDTSIEISGVGDDGCPSEATFTFNVSLNDPSLEWLVWSWATLTYSRFAVPDVGEGVRVAGPFGPTTSAP
ncbi:MAG: hypothetical protein RDU20_15880 [Desulfomonilaceae bacterium]|nr:hypothetical protein [Desulfomonilaceae bacterium]